MAGVSEEADGEGHNQLASMPAGCGQDLPLLVSLGCLTFWLMRGTLAARRRAANG
jgi:hypothetical protein